MRRRYDHVDLRVRSLAEARSFYETLLPALGFTRDVRIERWLQFEAAGVDSATEFFGLTELSRHVANECRIPFWEDSPSEVDRLAEIIVRRALGIWNILPSLYAAFQIPDAANSMLTTRESAMMNVENLCVAIRFAFVVFTTIILIPTATFVSSASNVTYKESLEYCPASAMSWSL
jgi:catechol 2,3-dioxygenase-like lactoylglutathione lyase family enzyme